MLENGGPPSAAQSGTWKTPSRVELVLLAASSAERAGLGENQRVEERVGRREGDEPKALMASIQHGTNEAPRHEMREHGQKN